MVSPPSSEPFFGSKIALFTTTEALIIQNCNFGSLYWIALETILGKKLTPSVTFIHSQMADFET